LFTLQRRAVRTLPYLVSGRGAAAPRTGVCSCLRQLVTGERNAVPARLGQSLRARPRPV